jgi:uridylate kinase
MAHIVVSLGGSVLIPDDRDTHFLMKVAELIRRLAKDHPMVVVCGGGKVSRYYIGIAKEMGASMDEQDQMGIDVTRLNAKLLQMAIGKDSFPGIPLSVDEAEQAALRSRIVVMGGTDPGHTTDAVSAMIAERLKAERIVNATSVEAAFSADPKKHPEAVRYSNLTHQQLLDLVNKGHHSAGPSDVFDKLGAEVAMRSNMPIYIIDGRNLTELEAAVRGESVKGTIVGNRP